MARSRDVWLDQHEDSHCRTDRLYDDDDDDDEWLFTKNLKWNLKAKVSILAYWYIIDLVKHWPQILMFNKITWNGTQTGFPVAAVNK